MSTIVQAQPYLAKFSMVLSDHFTDAVGKAVKVKISKGGQTSFVDPSLGDIALEGKGVRWLR